MRRGGKRRKRSGKAKGGLSMNMRSHVPTILSNRRIGSTTGRQEHVRPRLRDFIYRPSFLDSTT